MSYIDDNLMAGEQVIYRAKLHWAIFLTPIFWFIFALLFLGTESSVSGILMAFALIVSIPTFINYSSSEFGVTNKRVIGKVGFIRRSSTELLLTRVEGIQVRQSIMGRMLGYGSVTISGTGGLKEPFHKISNPLELRRVVQEQITNIEDSE